MLEKGSQQPLLPKASTPSKKPRRSPYITPLVGAAGLVLFFGPSLLSLIVDLASTQESLSIHPQPQTKIHWQECPDHSGDAAFSCGTLDVPLDYAKGFKGGSATLAVSRYSPDRKGGKEGKTKKKGTVLINPGGPGGSGYGKLALTGRTIGRRCHVRRLTASLISSL